MTICRVSRMWLCGIVMTIFSVSTILAINFYKRIQRQTCDVISLNFREELITYFPSIWHWQQRNWCIQKLSYYCMCICCHRKVFIEVLPNNIRLFWLHYCHIQVLGRIQRHRQRDYLINLPFIVQNKENILKLKGNLWNNLALCVFVCLSTSFNHESWNCGARLCSCYSTT
jgi:hypothetical protein